MVKRYDGNTGRVIRVEEPSPPPAPQHPEHREPPYREPPHREPPRRAPAPPGHGGALPVQLQRLLSGVGELETEDLLLLLILYLLYRESGDQDWLVTLGAMLFL